MKVNKPATYVAFQAFVAFDVNGVSTRKKFLTVQKYISPLFFHSLVDTLIENLNKVLFTSTFCSLDLYQGHSTAT